MPTPEEINGILTDRSLTQEERDKAIDKLIGKTKKSLFSGKK